MEMFNFSAGESSRFNRALTFITKKEADFDGLGDGILIVKTENFEDECEQLASYYPALGLENGHARLVFDTTKGGRHKILVNKAAISGLSYIHTMVTQMVHLANLSRYAAEYGNVYRFEAEQAIEHSYYEFLLWTKFQAMKIGTRAHALVSWHEVNGEAAPADGRYQFGAIHFDSAPVAASLEQLQEAGDIAAWRELFWDLLEELAFSFGLMAFYQQTARPRDLDERFPEPAIERMVGLDNCLALYASLQQARTFDQWQEQKKNIRAAIVAMQEKGRSLYKPGA